MQCSEYNPECREPGGCRHGEEGRLHTGFGVGVGYLARGYEHLHNTLNQHS